jgi:uncharacterized protein YyaL (SSP411 family)
VGPLKAAALSDFRFSPSPNQAHKIEWKPWAPETFSLAQEEDKPVLLSISAVWCYWCHVMDDTSYSDPDVQALLAQYFVAVRVDNDHRPDINSRYNVGGWPTTAFLTPHGGLIGGATYLPPDQFIAMLSELQEAYRAEKPQLYTQARDLLHRRTEQGKRVAAGPEVNDNVVDRISRVVAGSYDAAHGGFGSEPKFTNPGVLRFVAHLFRTSGESFYRAMLRKTLDSMAETPIYDDIDGGFYRHSASADWSEPQREKLSEDSLNLARVFLDGSILLDEPRYRAVAESTIDYLLGHLYDPTTPGFRGSQGANSDYFKLPAEERSQVPVPTPDDYCYTSSNGLAATILLDASWKLGRTDLTDIGLAVLDNLNSLATGDKFSHAYSADGPADAPAFLADWAWLLTALIQAHSSTAKPVYLDRAVEVASLLVDRFFDDEDGGFFDIEADEMAVGHMQVREKALAENVVVVEALVRLYQTTRNNDYRQVCEATLSAFVETFREQGEFAAAYGLAVDLFKNSAVEVTIEGRAEDLDTQDLLRAAVRLTSPNLEIKTVRAAEGDTGSRAHVCLDTVCLPPVSSPDALADAVFGLADQQDNPLENILQIYPGL